MAECLLGGPVCAGAGHAWLAGSGIKIACWAHSCWNWVAVLGFQGLQHAGQVGPGSLPRRSSETRDGRAAKTKVVQAWFPALSRGK